jgi:hypothetical protein
MPYIGPHATIRDAMRLVDHIIDNPTSENNRHYWRSIEKWLREAKEDGVEPYRAERNRIQKALDTLIKHDADKIAEHLAPLLPPEIDLADEAIVVEYLVMGARAEPFTPSLVNRSVEHICDRARWLRQRVAA